MVIRMNLAPVVVKVRPVWKRPGRRFPLRYFTGQPPRAFPGAALPGPLEALPAYHSEPEPAEAADDLVPVPAQRDDTWPWKGDGTGGGTQE